MLIRLSLIRCIIPAMHDSVKAVCQQDRGFVVLHRPSKPVKAGNPRRLQGGLARFATKVFERTEQNGHRNDGYSRVVM